MQTLFPAQEPAPTAAGELPLAARLRPCELDAIVGQGHLIGPGAPLRSALERGQLHSMILYGPPGSGKTTLARVLGRTPGYLFQEHSAVGVGLAQVRAVIERARRARSAGAGQRTLYFLDEIHRFNRAQQDALLHAVEEGLITLIGATTENPAFAINNALLSRARVYTLRALSEPELEEVLVGACARLREQDAESGQIGAGTHVSDEAIAIIAGAAEGDCRVALQTLELALELARAQGSEVARAQAAAALARRTSRYDRAGDRHYDYISAWIKATRGSDADAALYYLAVMLEGGEEPRFIARRMVILASEDIGNADPQALAVAVHAAHALELVGMPEAAYALAQAAIYLALAPKSNAAGAALARAREHVREHGPAPVPAHLVSGPRPGLERGERYDYPHEHPHQLSAQELLPKALAGISFYEPRSSEAALRERLAEIARLRPRS
ncbi:MAG TPA: AAA family ATPase [Solirubrobacteraceae bacterium]|nr:AAA family ATPase [Solirubrobacteraceae bacterium]